MYSVVLMLALGAAEESPGIVVRRGYPTPHYSSGPGMGHYGYNGGYQWPGYACWGGCGGYASPAYGYPMSPIVAPPANVPYWDDEEDTEKEKDKGTRKKGAKKVEDDDDEPSPPKRSPKKAGDEETNSVRLTLLLPAGAKVRIDGKPVAAAAVKTFLTPAPEVGPTYYYEVTAELGGLAVTRKVRLTAGADVRADFRDLAETAVVSGKR